MSDKLGNRLGRERRVDHYDERCAGDACDRCNVLNEVETQLFKEARIDRIGRCGLKECVTVRDCADDRVGRYVGASSWLVLDDEWLTEPLRKPLSDQARNDIGRATRRNAYDDPHGP